MPRDLRGLFDISVFVFRRNVCNMAFEIPGAALYLGEKRQRAHLPNQELWVRRHATTVISMIETGPEHLTACF